MSRFCLSSQLREIIASRGLTAYAVGRSSGVDPGVVQRFLTGERDIRMGTADRIATALGLRLVEVGRKVRGRPARGADPIVEESDGPSGEEGTVSVDAEPLVSTDVQAPVSDDDVLEPPVPFGWGDGGDSSRDPFWG